MEKEILSVSELNEYIKGKLENDYFLNNVFVKGEITNLTKHYSGHYYFSIKDEECKVSCMMFASYVKTLTFDLKNGDEVIILGHVSVYEKTGTYQLYARKIEPYGQGKELLKLKLLKEKLQKEGLFDLEKKKLPLFPNKIGIITSKSGAAVRDLIHSIQQRWNPEIYIFPCLVQGEDAPRSIIEQLDIALNYKPDVIIISRGGGANEDLSAFNDEELVRKVANYKIPIVSAVGHQIDNSLIDLVADVNCITPTEAGIKVTPSKDDIKERILSNNDYLNTLITSKIDSLKTRLLQINSSKAMIPPLDKIKLKINHINELALKNKFVIERILKDYQNKSSNLIESLKLLNPLLSLDKGYSLVKNKQDEIINSINLVKEKEHLKIYFKDGSIEVEVIKRS